MIRTVGRAGGNSAARYSRQAVVADSATEGKGTFVTRLAKAPSAFTLGRNGGRVAVLALAMACALLLASATGASAATKYYDSNFGTTSANATAVPPTPSGTAFGGFFSSTNSGVGDIAVNDSTITTDGTGQSNWIYVVDRGSNRIQAFDSDKNFQWAIGRDVIATTVNEAQVLTVSATGGKYKLEFNGKTTPDLAWNATASTLQTELRKLESLGGPGANTSVSVTGTPANGTTVPVGRYAIAFTGTGFSATNQNQITVQPATEALTGTASVQTIADGVAAVPGNLGDVFEKCSVASHCKGGSTGTAADGPGGEFNIAAGIDIDQATGDLFVSERATSTAGGGAGNRRVQQFSADGQFIRAFGWDVVASGPGNTGGFETCNAAAADVCQAATAAGTAPGQFGNRTTPSHNGLAVGRVGAPNAGQVYVADPGNARILPFTIPAGPTAMVSPGVPFGSAAQFGPPTGLKASAREIATDALGVVYSLKGPEGGEGLVRYDTTESAFLPMIIGQGDANQFGDGNGGESTVLEVDPATDHVLFGRSNGRGIVELDLSSKPASLDESHIVDRHALGLLAGVGIPQALGVGRSPSRFFLSSSAELTGSGTGQRVLVLDESGVDPPPTIELLTPTDVECTTATMRANVNPNGPTGFTTSYRFQLSLDGVEWTDVSADQVIGDGNVPVFVDDGATGLGANSEYRVRVRSQRSPDAGTIVSPELLFSTDPCPPQAETQFAAQVNDVSAQLNGRLQPGGIDTDYWFEWGTDTSYGNQIPALAATSDDPFPRLVSESLGGLAPQTTYHYRLCAQNALSPSKVCGLDQPFTTRSAAAVPAGRAYEMVTSPDKVLRRGGAHGTFGTELARFQQGAPSADGDSLMWGMYAGISDPDAGASWSGDYVYELRNREDRSGDGKADGWYGQSLHTAAPHTPAASAVNDLRLFSADLRTSSWDYQVPLFANGSKGTVHVAGDDGGPLGKGYYPLFDEAWVSSPSTFGVSIPTTMSDDGERLLLQGDSSAGIASFHRLQGVDDPLAPDELSPPQTAGAAPFLADSSSDWAPRDMIGECTGAGATATLLPSRDDKGTEAGPPGAFDLFATYTAGDPTLTVDFNFGGPPLVGHTVTGGTGVVGSKVIAVTSSTFTVSPAPSASGSFTAVQGGQDVSMFADDEVAVRQCGEGSPTSTKGATLRPSGGRLGGSAVTAMSDDGNRVFFVSPDPAASGVPAACVATDTAAGTGTDCPPQLFVRQYDDDGDATVRWISRAEPALFNAPQKIGLLGSGAAFEGASRDGSVVYFRTDAPLTVDDPNGAGVAPPPGGVTTGTASGASWDLYRYELPGDNNTDPASGTLTRVSGGPGGSADPNTNCTSAAALCGAAANGGGNVVRFMSDDGERVYFVTAAQIPGAANASPANGTTTPTAASAQVNATERNLYLYDAAKPGAAAYEFIARIPFELTGAGLEKCLSSEPSGSGPARGIASISGAMSVGAAGACVQGTRSGDAIAFETPAQLTVDDVDDAVDVYLYEADGDELVRVSAPPAGTTPYACATQSNAAQITEVCNGDLGFGSGGYAEASKSGSARNRNVNMAEDQNGELTAVFFESQVPFVEADQNDRMDVYEWQASDGRLGLLSPGHPGHGAYFTGNDRSGRDVFFWTEQRISPWELDPVDGDVYDARRGGGIPDPPALPPACAVLAGTCQGAPPAPPAASGAASASLAGQGNFTGKRKPGKGRCAKGKVRRSGKCVKKHEKKKQKSSKRDKRSQGRAGR